MDYYAGLDVSEEATSVCVIEGRGQTISEAEGEDGAGGAGDISGGL